MDVRIDKKFKALIPPLTDEERRQLEENIEAAGKAYDTIKVWEGKIVDGHNRYDICRKLKLPFKVEQLKFESRDHAEAWVINNQFGRRNVGPFQRSELALKLKEAKAAIATAAKEQAGKETGRGNKKVLPNLAKPLDTREELAEVAGVSHGYISTVERIQAAADEGLVDEETLEDLRADRVSANKVISELKKAARQEEIEQQKQDIESGKVELPTGKYEVVVMDPPWAYGREYDPEGSRVANPYPEMTHDQLLAMDPPFAKDCVLFLWTTHQFIWDAGDLLDNWGFDYKATIVWDKQKIGMGSWVRMQCEFCLLAVKGKPFFENTSYRDFISEARREHSRKPDAFYEFVEAVTAGRRLDYFSRKQREGWEGFGNDQSKF
jgi:N6-adenosine-specific RNA methylase IME4